MITKQQVEPIVLNSLKDLAFENHGLGIMHKKERVFLNTLNVIKSMRDVTGTVYDVILNQEDYLKYYEFKREIEKDRKYARLNGINELAATNHF